MRKLLVQCAHHIFGHWGKRFGVAALGFIENRRRTQSDVAGRRGGGSKAIRAVAPLVGEE